MKIPDGELDRLMDLAKRGGDDPLNPDDYSKVLDSITESRGKSTCRLVTLA